MQQSVADASQSHGNKGRRVGRRDQLHIITSYTLHYHLVVETPEANLSRCMHWLNVSYATWFNVRNGRVGPLFQGRFKSILVEDASWAYSLSFYVHLNPVMHGVFGLDRKGRKQERRGLRKASQSEVSNRFNELREYPWGSYRCYAGYERSPPWLTTKIILSRTGGSSRKDQMARYRREARIKLSMGPGYENMDELRDTIAVGSEVFRDSIRKVLRASRETVKPSGYRRLMDWSDIIRNVEYVLEEKSSEFMELRGHIGLPLVMWAARRYGGMTLNDVGECSGGMGYTAVAMRLKRLEERAVEDTSVRRIMNRIASKCEM